MCGSKWKLDKKCHLEIVKNLIFFLHQSCWWVMKRSVWESLISGIFKTDLSRLIIDHGFDIKKALFFSKKWHNEGGGSRKRKKSFFPLPLRNQQKKKIRTWETIFFFSWVSVRNVFKRKKTVQNEAFNTHCATVQSLMQWFYFPSFYWREVKNK